jgi:AcrR family transcriptional regulator
MARVKSRTYNSPRRREQAAATRVAILEAAQRLFERQGYAATTIVAIAAEAQVASKTLYLAFETKGGVLRALWNRLLRGDDEEVPVAEREWYREVVEEQDPERQLRLNARNSRARKERVGVLLDVIRSGAPVDPEVEALWERIQTEFHANQRVLVEKLAERKALKRGLDVDRATDILWMLNHPDVWQHLVRERGWTPEEYERWFADSACAQLLEPRKRSRRGPATAS